MKDQDIITQAYSIVDSLIQDRTLRYHEHITGWKHDLAMEGYTLWLENKSKSLQECIKQVHQERVNKSRQRGDRSPAVIIPFSCVSRTAVTKAVQIPANQSNIEEHNTLCERFESCKHLMTQGEQDVVHMLLDGLTIKEICNIMGVVSSTIYRAVQTIKSKVEGAADGKRERVPEV